MVIGAGGMYLASAATTSYTLWGTSIPRTLAVSSSSGVELGVRFHSTVAGYVTGVRFYKSAQNTGTHTGDLWDSQGRLLATVIFKNETSSGWQTATFATPVSLASGANYVVSYHAPNGHYSLNKNYLSTTRTRKALVAPMNTVTDPNGVYADTTTPKVFPTQSGNGANYWVDVVFNTKLINPQPAPAAPTGVIASAQTNGSVAINWQASVSTGTITGYTLYRDGNKYASLGNVTTYTDASTQPGTTYTYQLQATDSTGQTSALSATVSATTPSSGGTTTPPPPTGGGTTTGCATATPHVPDGPDGMGGCWPGPSNTGPNAAESTMAAYTGSCIVTAANTVIDSKVIKCSPLEIADTASGLVIKNSYIKGGVINDNNASFTIQDSLLNNAVNTGYACGDPNNATTDCGVGYKNFTILRTEIMNSNRAAYCESTCTIQDSYFHGTNLDPVKTDLAHASSVRNEQYLTLKHNALGCDFTGPFNNTEIGCSADMSGYPDFAPIMHDTIDSNLFLSNNIGAGFCVYGGGTSGKPFSGNANNATYIVFQNNVFQRGANGKCGSYGAVTDFITGRPGNAWTNNKYDNGTVVDPA
ncbi:MAG TPA: DUF4082 domain-containing protein [Candidatus Saccharimonadales bacterium]|nr:DUF4082 domain-containing protein [Candidatus Saccharimonadales bacterium]